MINWFEMKELLYVFLTVCGIALLVGSYPAMHSANAVAQVCGFILLVTGLALSLFGLVTYLCRDDWEIWS